MGEFMGGLMVTYAVGFGFTQIAIWQLHSKRNWLTTIQRIGLAILWPLTLIVAALIAVVVALLSAPVMGLQFWRYVRGEFAKAVEGVEPVAPPDKTATPDKPKPPEPDPGAVCVLKADGCARRRTYQTSLGRYDNDVLEPRRFDVVFGEVGRGPYDIKVFIYEAAS